MTSWQPIIRTKLEIKRKSPKRFNSWGIICCFIVIFACKTNSPAKLAIKTFNHEVCNDYAYLSGSLNVNLKHLLSYVFKLAEFRHHQDTTYCIIRNYEFSGTTVAFCFNRTDSVFAHLYNDPDSGNLNIKYKLQDKLYRYKCTIRSSKISSKEIKKLKEYKCYFDSLVLPKYDLKTPFKSDDGQFSSMILKYCHTCAQQMTYFKFIGDSLVREPYVKLGKEDQKVIIKVY